MQVPAVNGLLTLSPDADRRSQTAPPHPFGGLLDQLADKATRTFAELTKPLQDASRKLAGRSSGEPYQPRPDDRELSKVVAYSQPDETFPWPQGSTLRLVLTPDEFLFVECPLLGAATVALRLQHSELLIVRTHWIPVADMGQVFLDSIRYSAKDCRILYALEGPREVMSLALMYHDDTRYDKARPFFGLHSRFGGMKLEESAYHINQAIIAEKRRVQQESRRANDQHMEMLRGHAAASKEYAARLSQSLETAKSHRAAAAEKLAELNAQLAQLEAARAQRKASPTGPSVLLQIEQLGQLRDKGLITDEEFVAKKQELLSRL